MNASDIAAQFEKDLGKSKRGLSAQYENTRECIAFYNGDMMSYKDDVQFRSADGQKKRAIVEFNKIKPNIDAVVGFMAQNRAQVKYMARIKSPLSDLFSRYKNAIADYVRENSYMDHIETEQDLDMLVNGYGATETDISYLLGGSANDPNGEITKVKLDPMTVGWDATCKSKNVYDSSFVWYYKDFNLKDAVELFDESEDKFEQVPVSDDNSGFRFNPYGGVYDKIKIENSVEWVSEKEERVRVYNYQYTKIENFYRANNPLFTVSNPDAALIIQGKLEYIAAQVKKDEYSAGSLFDFNPKAQVLTFDDELKPLIMEQFGSVIKPVKFKRRCYYTAIISGRHVFKYYKSISQQGFSVKIKTGTYDAHNKIWVGMVNSMMNPQKYYNKALTELMFTIASNSKGGVMVERSSITNINDFSSKWAKTDAVIVVEDGALSGDRIQEKGRATVPTGLENVITLTDSAVADASGIDRSFLGAREDAQESGVMYRRRIRQVVTTMARYMDSIAMYRKQDARLMSDYIRVWVENNDGSLVRVTGQDGIQEFMQLSMDKLVDEYDITMQESPQTPEEKQETALTISGFGDKIAMSDPQAAKAFYLESIKLLNIDSDIEQKLTEALQPKDAVSPQEVQQLQMMMQAQQAEIESLKGYIEAGNVRKTIADAALQEAKAKTEMARSVEVAESADNKALENDILRENAFSADKVSVSI